MKPGSKSWKNLMSKMYGIGAAIVIIGALFKIQHWEGASEMLIVGLGTEAIIFFFSAFEPLPKDDPDWTIVYPQLATGEGAKTAVQELDNLLEEANIDSQVLQNLGDGMRNLGDQASKMSEMADAAVATQEFSDSLVKASNRVNDMADTYEGVSNSLTGLVGSKDASVNAGDNLQKMNENLQSLNNMYDMQLEQLKENKALYAGMGELVKTLNDSVEDTRAYKEHIAELAKNLATLNTVYGNMLNAMGGSKS